MVLEKLKKLIAAQFEISPDTITEETDFLKDLRADSLDIVELAMEVEEAFELPEIDEEDIKGIQTVGDLVTYITAHLS